MRFVRERLGWPGAFLAVVALAGWARLARFPTIFRVGEIFMLDGDSAYHLRRILATARSFPRVPTFDAWMDWPRGGLCPWADAFDLAGAAWLRLVTRADAVEHAKLAVALFPVVLGLLVVWVTIDVAALLARERPDRRAVAWVAGLLTALLPQAVASSAVGRPDHHVAEALFTLLLVGWSLRGVDAAVHMAARGRRLAWEAAGALAIAGALCTFAGGTLYVAVAAAPLLAVRVLRRGPTTSLAGSGAPALFAGAALSAAASVPAMLQHRHVVSFLFPSLLQPLLVTTGGALLALTWAAPRLAPSLRGARARLALAGGAIVLAAAGSLAIPAVRMGLTGWLLRRDPWIATIAEFQPLWSPRLAGGVAEGLRYLFASPGLAAAVALPVSVGAVVRAGDRGRAAAWTWCVGALAALTLLQNRFGRVFAPFLAIACALALAEVVRAVASATRSPRLAGAMTVAAALLWAFADPRLGGQLRVAAARAPNAAQAAALDLRDAPPVLPGGGAGVLAPWDFGHDFEVVGERPVVANGFGSYLSPEAFADAQGAYGMTVDGLLGLMERRDLGFIAGGALAMSAAGVPQPFTRESPRRLDLGALGAMPLAPLAIGGSGVPGQVPHLGHFMPRFASATTVAGLAFPLPELWVFERVRGAVVRGSAPPGVVVTAELPFRENGRPHLWKAWTVAGDDGRWQLIVPVPTGYARPTFWTGAAWSLRITPGTALAVAVPEQAVRGGGVLEVAVAPSVSK